LNKILVILFVVLLFTPRAEAQQGGSVPIEEIEDQCLREVMAAGNIDFENLSQSELISMCQDMPLSEDLFVQMLSVIVGPPMYDALEIVSALTNKPHGMAEDSPILTIAKPFHDIAKAFNYVMVSIFALLLSANLLSQLVKWQKTGSKTDIQRWFSNKSPPTLVTGLLLAPVMGWLSPLQFLAIIFITGLGVLTKFAVVYLFLGAFFSDATTQIKEDLSSDLEWGLGKTILIHQCDIKQREDLLLQVQRVERSSNPSVLESNGLYSCLTSGAINQPKMTRINSTDQLNTFAFEPGNLVQTRKCIEENKLLLDEWGVSEPASCGHILLKLPNNTASNSAGNAVNLYANENIINTEREIALKLHEYECRQPENILLTGGGPVPGCIQAEISGSGYRYSSVPDPITGEQGLGPYKLPLGDDSARTLRDEIIRGIGTLERNISSNTAGMLQHVKDITAPYTNDSTLSPEAKKEFDDFRQGVISDYEEGGAVGFSESDGKFLVSNIKRGAWASGSLFFGKFADEIKKDMLIDKLASVYDAKLLTQMPSKTIYSLFGLKSVIAGQDLGDQVGDSISSALMPRVGLYVESMECWYHRVDCTPAPLNPFTYLGETGAGLVEGGLIRFGIASGLGAMAKVVMGKDAGKFMLTETLKDFYLLYTILGIMLAILIPAIPLIKLLIMLINWTYDVVRELFGLQITLAISPLGSESKKVFNDDVRDAFIRLVGLGLYFLFIVLGVCAMFVMFSFLFGLNVFFVGILSYVVQWTGAANSIETMVINTIFDVIIVGVLIYEVKLCTTYIEKFPQELAEFFKINVSESSSVMDWFESKMRSAVMPKVGDFLSRLKG
jgi:hypothetical protein